jgi:hypothetical protein
VLTEEAVEGWQSPRAPWSRRWGEVAPSLMRSRNRAQTGLGRCPGHLGTR